MISKWFLKGMMDVARTITLITYAKEKGIITEEEKEKEINKLNNRCKLYKILEEHDRIKAEKK